MIYKTLQKTKRSSNTNPSKNQGWTHVLRIWESLYRKWNTSYYQPVLFAKKYVSTFSNGISLL